LSNLGVVILLKGGHISGINEVNKWLAVAL